MELALEIGGCTVAELKRRMSVEELRDWRRFARRHLLPARRLEITVAAITRATIGGSIEDHLVRPPPDDLPIVEAVKMKRAQSDAHDAGAELSALSGSGVVVIDMKTGRRL